MTRPVFIDSVPFRGLVGGAVHVRENPSERDVEVPPARLITDSSGAMWTLGTEFRQSSDGWLEFNVLRNDRDTGEMATKIVYRGGRVTIFGSDGWRRYTGKQFI